MLSATRTLLRTAATPSSRIASFAAVRPCSIRTYTTAKEEPTQGPAAATEAPKDSPPSTPDAATTEMQTKLDAQSKTIAELKVSNSPSTPPCILDADQRYRDVGRTTTDSCRFRELAKDLDSGESPSERFRPHLFRKRPRLFYRHSPHGPEIDHPGETLFGFERRFERTSRGSQFDKEGD